LFRDECKDCPDALQKCCQAIILTMVTAIKFERLKIWGYTSFLIKGRTIIGSAEMFSFPELVRNSLLEVTLGQELQLFKRKNYLIYSSLIVNVLE
jgi:hypothetical protein